MLRLARSDASSLDPRSINDNQFNMFNTNAGKSKFFDVLHRFAMFFVPLFLFFCSFIAAEYFADSKVFLGNLKHEEKQQVKIATKAVTNEMHNVLSDLIFLSRLNEVWDLLDDVDDERAWHMLAQEILYFSESKNVYDQITILGSEGQELIRVNFDDGAPHIVEKEKLKNKKERTYFNDSFKLNIGGVYMSPFKTNQLGSSIIHFATPLFASTGKQGVLLFDYRSSELINIMYQKTIEISTHISMVNEDGIWLASPFQDERKVFFSNSENSFSLAFPEAWAKIGQQDSGNFVIKHGMFSFETVYPKTSILEYYSAHGAGGIENIEGGKSWKLISRVSPAKLNSQTRLFYQRHWLPYATVLFLLSIISFFLSQNSLRRNAIREHANYERRFLMTLGNIELPVVRLNTHGEVIYCNSCLLSILKLTEEDVIGENWFDNFVDVGIRNKERKLFNEIISSATPPISTDTCIYSFNSERHYISWNNTLSTDPHGNVVTLTSIGNDITEQKRLEKEVDKRNQEITKAQTLAAMGKMASMIAHDLRNPLSSIKMTLQILGKNSSGKYPEGIDELSELSLEQVHYMESILEEVLLYSRPDALQCDWLCIGDVLGRSINMLQRMIQDDHAEIIEEYQKSIPRIYADSNKLCQVFNNLLSNALQAAADNDIKPVITIRTRVVLTDSMPRIQIDIIDNGPGIETTESGKLFDPFYTTRAKGTGLGLPIVKRIVEQHKGTIRLYNVKTGGGVCGQVTLPTNSSATSI